MKFLEKPISKAEYVADIEAEKWSTQPYGNLLYIDESTGKRYYVHFYMALGTNLFWTTGYDLRPENKGFHEGTFKNVFLANAHSTERLAPPTLRRLSRRTLSVAALMGRRGSSPIWDAEPFIYRASERVQRGRRAAG